MRNVILVTTILILIAVAGYLHRPVPPNTARVRGTSIELNGRKFENLGCLWGVYPGNGDYSARYGVDGTVGGEITFYYRNGQVITACDVQEGN